jgi:hypothetical protein
MIKIIPSILALAVFASSIAAAETVEAPKARPYTLPTCIVTGEKLGEMGDPVVIVREGREIKLCCKGCVKKFDKDPASFLKKIDEAEKAKTDKPAGANHGAHHH